TVSVIAQLNQNRYPSCCSLHNPVRISYPMKPDNHAPEKPRAPLPAQLPLRLSDPQKPTARKHLVTSQSSFPLGPLNHENACFVTVQFPSSGTRPSRTGNKASHSTSKSDAAAPFSFPA